MLKKGAFLIRKVSIHLPRRVSKQELAQSLYRLQHKTLNKCIRDVIDLDDNCNIYGKDKLITGSDTSSAKSSVDTEREKEGEVEAMVEKIMKRMNQDFWPPQMLQRCEVCTQDHPTFQCLPKLAYQMPNHQEWRNGVSLSRNGQTMVQWAVLIGSFHERTRLRTSTQCSTSRA